MFPLVPPVEKEHKNCVPYFQMCLMARLKALGILRWNMGSDMKIHEVQSSTMVLIDVVTNHSFLDTLYAVAKPLWKLS